MIDATIQAGMLRHRVTIECFVRTGTGPRGQPAGDWQPLWENVPVALKSLGRVSGKQVEITRQLVASATHLIQMRYHDGITAGMRARLGTRTFAIGAVDEGDHQQHWMALAVTEQITGSVP